MKTEPEQQPAGQGSSEDQATQLARVFHNIYEALAPDFGYETRKETRDFEPTTPNGRLMVAVCKEIIGCHFPKSEPKPATASDLEQLAREAMSKCVGWIETDTDPILPEEREKLTEIILDSYAKVQELAFKRGKLEGVFASPDEGEVNYVTGLERKVQELTRKEGDGYDPEGGYEAGVRLERHPIQGRCTCDPPSISDRVYECAYCRRISEAASGKQEQWTVEQWRDGAGNLTSSYEIYEGEKLVVADLLKDECEKIANAHNASNIAEDTEALNEYVAKECQPLIQGLHRLYALRDPTCQRQAEIAYEIALAQWKEKQS